MGSHKTVLFTVMVSVGALALAAGGRAFAADEPGSPAPYVLKTCPVTGHDLHLMGEPVSKVYDGREIKFCCPMCPAKFEANKAKYMAEIDAAIIKQQLPSYPLETCPVSGQALSKMAHPVNYVYGDRLVRFCCPGCEKKFEKDQATYLKKLDDAIVAAQKVTYASDQCPVSGERLGDHGPAVNYVVGNKLIKLCCKSCEKTVRKNAAEYLDKVSGESSSGK